MSSACALPSRNSANSGSLTPQSAQSLYTTPLYVGNKKISVQIVKTDQELASGLSGREKLLDSEGMLFDFGKSLKPVFWMKDMNFDLDLIWIKNKKIVGITADVPAPVKDGGLKIQDSALPLYPSPSEVDMVLEVRAGWSKKNNIKIGDEIGF
jgi:uncharacterized membrane protein (UPF0127 family)